MILDVVGLEVSAAASLCLDPAIIHFHSQNFGHGQLHINLARFLVVANNLWRTCDTFNKISYLTCPLSRFHTPFNEYELAVLTSRYAKMRTSTRNLAVLIATIAGLVTAFMPLGAPTTIKVSVTKGHIRLMLPFSQDEPTDHDCSRNPSYLAHTINVNPISSVFPRPSSRSWRLQMIPQLLLKSPPWLLETRRLLFAILHFL